MTFIVAPLNQAITNRQSKFKRIQDRLGPPRTTPLFRHSIFLSLIGAASCDLGISTIGVRAFHQLDTLRDGAGSKTCPHPVACASLPSPRYQED
jgi:hypothetical protein